jgi:hypothetical protein
MIDLTDCPECGAPAEVRWRAVLSGTEGRAALLCARQHWIVVPASSLPVPPIAIAIPIQRVDSPVRLEVSRRPRRWPRP